MSAPDPVSGLLRGLFSGLEKVAEANTFFLLATLVLVADAASFYVHGLNLLDLASDPAVLKPQIAVEAVLTFLAFGLILLIAPGLSYLLRSIRCLVPLMVNESSLGSSDRSSFSIETARHYAFGLGKPCLEADLREYLKAKVKIAEDQDVQAAQVFEMRSRAASFAAATCVTSLIDLHFASTATHPSLLRLLASNSGNAGWIWTFIAFVGIFAAFPDPLYESPKIFCPLLASAREAARRKEEEELARVMPVAWIASEPPSFGPRSSNKFSDRP